MNYEHEDENLRELFMDFRFREALSISLNRQEVNELIFDGDATPSNISPTEGPPHHGEDPLFKETYLQHDPDRANQLLDEIGLTNRDNEGFRTFEDGSQLTISLLVGSWTADDPEIAEMYRQYWADVGLRVVVRNQSAELIGQAMQAGEYDMRMSSTAAGGRPMNIFTRGALMPLGDGWTIQPEWGAWAGTNGAEGAEPPDSIKRLREIYEEGVAEPDADRRIALVREAFEIVINNQWVIGGLNQPQTSKYRVFQNSLRNVHVEGEMNPTELYPSQPAQWYLRQ
jgi:peptide/nickel transport system substrate-binding protein